MAKVRLFFWFDVEDYVTPESDEALGRLVDIFDRRGLSATFKMVGEKVRGLRQRGHEAILSKLRAHDIGYHTDYHSKPPSISEYVMQCDWAGGIAEFIRREQPGLEALEQAFGRIPSCYGQPGGSWAPHVYPALRQWGLPVYLDAGPWVALDGRPHRYCDVLNLLGLKHTMSIGISQGEREVGRRLAQVEEIIEQLRHTGGEVSLYAHECEFVTAQFWDGINYRGGKDTPRDQWRPAPLIDQDESELRYAAMDCFLAAVQLCPDVEIVVASQARTLYSDQARHCSFTPQEIAQAAEAMGDGITHQRISDAWLSPAEVFSLTVRLLAERVRTGMWPKQVPYRYVDGPPRAPHVEAIADRLSLDAVFGTCLYEAGYLAMHRQMPPEVQVGRAWLAPADFLATIGAVLPRWVGGSTEDAPIVEGDLLQEAYVPDHVSWDWIVFPPGFDGDPLLEVGKLQSWTLKPAV
jgi:peptidoglycan/xylan/chitin deacetylase (PgdA/CDA1 family)